MENPIKMDDLGVPLFSETSIYFQMVKTAPISGEPHFQGLRFGSFPTVVSVKLKRIAVRGMRGMNMWDFLWTGMFLGKHLNKLLIENLQVFHKSNFFQDFFWNFGYRTNMETFPAARKFGDVTDWPCDQCISEVSLDGCVDSSRSFCWSLKGFIDKVADVHFLHQGEALRLQRPPVHFCVDGCCLKKHSNRLLWMMIQ